MAGMCQACPVRSIDPAKLRRPCPVVDHPPGCALVAAGQPGRAATIVAFATRTPLPRSDAEQAAMDAETCTWADPDGPCGCGGPDAPPRICRKPGRPGEVRRPYCLQCVTLPDWGGRPE